MSCFDFDKAIVAELSFLNNISKKYEISEEERQDLVSDTILKAYKYKDTTEFESRGKFKGWIVLWRVILSIKCEEIKLHS